MAAKPATVSNHGFDETFGKIVKESKFWELEWFFDVDPEKGMAFKKPVHSMPFQQRNLSFILQMNQLKRKRRRAREALQRRRIRQQQQLEQNQQRAAAAAEEALSTRAAAGDSSDPVVIGATSTNGSATPSITAITTTTTTATGTTTAAPLNEIRDVRGRRLPSWWPPSISHLYLNTSPNSNHKGRSGRRRQQQRQSQSIGTTPPISRRPRRGASSSIRPDLLMMCFHHSLLPSQYHAAFRYYPSKRKTVMSTSSTRAAASSSASIASSPKRKRAMLLPSSTSLPAAEDSTPIRRNLSRAEGGKEESHKRKRDDIIDNGDKPDLHGAPAIGTQQSSSRATKKISIAGTTGDVSTTKTTTTGKQDIATMKAPPAVHRRRPPRMSPLSEEEATKEPPKSIKATAVVAKKAALKASAGDVVSLTSGPATLSTSSSTANSNSKNTNSSKGFERSKKLQVRGEAEVQDRMEMEREHMYFHFLWTNPSATFGPKESAANTTTSGATTAPTTGRNSRTTTAATSTTSADCQIAIWTDDPKDMPLPGHRRCPFCYCNTISDVGMLVHCRTFHADDVLEFDAVRTEDGNLHISVRPKRHLPHNRVSCKPTMDQKDSPEEKDDDDDRKLPATDASQTEEQSRRRSNLLSFVHCSPKFLNGPPSNAASLLPTIPFIDRDEAEIARMDNATRRRNLLGLKQFGAPAETIAKYNRAPGGTGTSNAPASSSTTQTATTCTPATTSTRPIRQYFHSRTNIPMLEAEWYDDVDSDDEPIDELWLTSMSEALLDEFKDVSPSEKIFMKLWNAHTFCHTVLADGWLPRLCAEFLGKHRTTLVHQDLRQEWLLHLMNLWDNSLLSARHVKEFMAMYDDDDDDDDTETEDEEEDDNARRVAAAAATVSATVGVKTKQPKKKHSICMSDIKDPPPNSGA